MTWLIFSTHLLSILIDITTTSTIKKNLNLRVPLCTSTFTTMFLIAFKVYTLEKNNTSPLHILCMIMPQITTHLTLTLVQTWYERAPPPPSPIQ
jgi:hypothetical protein